MANLGKEFSKIYDQNVRKIYRFIYIKVNSQEVAEDLTSETFLRGWESFKSKPQIKNPTAFLYQIARNLVTDFYRKKDQTKCVSLENCREISDPRIDLEQGSIIRSEVENIRNVLRGLKDDYQNVVIWRYVEDLSIAEIAQMMEKSEGAVRVMLHRALKEIREKLLNNKNGQEECNKRQFASSS